MFRSTPAPMDRPFRISPSWLFVLPAILLGLALERGARSAQSPCPSSTAAEVHYGPGEDLERIDVALLHEAAKQIDMAAYVLTDSAVIEALREASARCEGSRLARRRRSGETKRVRRGGPAWWPSSRPRASVKRAGRRTDAPERLLRRSSPIAHRLGQFQPVRRDAPGQ
jgi:hypothetical protein